MDAAIVATDLKSKFSASALRRVGPAFVVGACIIGPGSVTLMSRTGSLYGYSLLWLAILSGALMAGFIALFMRFGVYSEADATVLGVVAAKLGRPFAVLCGLSLFLMCATFQFGNCLGVSASLGTLAPTIPRAVWPAVFTMAAIIFMFSLKRIYGIVEKLMVFLLLLMLLAFLVNLLWARPSITGIVTGACIPAIPSGVDWVTVGGLVATTFAIVAAMFQPYLVKAKGWTEKDLNSAMLDTVLASMTYTLIGCVIMITAAAVLHPHTTIDSATAMASQLQGAFGAQAKVVFCVGFCAAAFSSFIVASLIGGVLLNDGLGLGGRLESIPTKIFAAFVLLAGMTTSISIILLSCGGSGLGPAETQIEVKAIAVAQAVTMLAVPLAAVATVVVLLDRRAVKGRGLSPWVKVFVLFGSAVLLGIAFMMYLKVRPELAALLGFG